RDRCTHARLPRHHHRPHRRPQRHRPRPQDRPGPGLRLDALPRHTCKPAPPRVYCAAMSFLAALFALLLDQAFRHLESIRDARWFSAYAEAFAGMTGSADSASATLGAVLIVLVPAVLALFVGDILNNLWEGFSFVFAAAVFWFCLGPRDLHAQAEAYMDAVQAGDETRASAVAGEILDAVPPSNPAER